MTAGDRVRLTEAGRARFPDIGSREGTIQRMEGWAIVDWDRLTEQVRVPAEDLEIIGGQS